MYKIKLFSNMSGISAGQSVRQMLSNKDWWKGMFSNIVSTMIGIALTIGVAALVEYHNNKKQSREMMFNVINVCEDNTETLEKFDSIFQMQIAAIDTLVELYHAEHEFKDSLTKAQEDTLTKYIDRAFKTVSIFYSHNQVGKYFYSAQMMHQFGNADMYNSFSSFVQVDELVNDNINEINKKYLAIMCNMDNMVNVDGLSTQEAVAEVIRNHSLTEYQYQIRASMLSTFIKAYKDLFSVLLEEMDATKEEYEDYKESIDDGTRDKSHLYKSDI